MQAPPLSRLPPPDAIKRVAEDVVARPYYDLDAITEMRWPMLERIWNLLDRLTSPIRRIFEGLYEASPFLAWLVLIGMFLLAAALVVHIAYSFAVAIRMRSATALPEDGASDDVGDPAEWERRARAAAGKGEFGTAIRDLLRAGLLALTASRGERFRTGATNREYLRRFGSTNVAESLQLLVETVDLTWYGGRAATEEDFTRCAASHAQITAVARRATHARRA